MRRWIRVIDGDTYFIAHSYLSMIYTRNVSTHYTFYDSKGTAGNNWIPLEVTVK